MKRLQVGEGEGEGGGVVGWAGLGAAEDGAGAGAGAAGVVTVLAAGGVEEAGAVDGLTLGRALLGRAVAEGDGLMLGTAVGVVVLGVAAAAVGRS
ncbi:MULTISPECIES: hypothetical protein [unclassified Kitasatospora]|uniref:hypothetical protein n=1 Tax=unclassified Kitasatospora TaxID=2633591 RepID=UPI0012F8D708|nr:MULTISPECIES: hypothetical protein [unclassified Kitasatospora]